MRRKLTDNVKRVRERIAEACSRVGRNPRDVKLLAVTKSVEVDVIRQLLEAGVTDLGENRAQELSKRAGMIAESRSRRLLVAKTDVVLPTPTWHMIGHLQRNKVRMVLPWARTIHSVDSLRVAEEISKHSAAAGCTTDVFVQVNVSEERTKFGVVVGAMNYLIADIVQMPNVRLVGLMTMAPYADDPEESRPHFARLRELFDDVVHDEIGGPHFQHLSMGMSNDFEVAIEEGATIIRVGTALFEGITASVS